MIEESQEDKGGLGDVRLIACEGAELPKGGKKKMKAAITAK